MRNRVPHLRVLFIHHTPSLYGASRSLLLLLEGLQEFGVEARVALPQDGPLVPELRKRGVLTYVIPFRGWLSDRRNPMKRAGRMVLVGLDATRVAAAAGKWSPHVIYTNTSATPVGGLVSALLRRPHIWHIREFGWEDYGLRFDLGLRMSGKLIDRASVRVVCVSHAVASKYARLIHPQKLRVVYNPISLVKQGNRCVDRVAARQDSELLLGGVGVLSPGKGQEDVLWAAKILKDRGITTRVRFVGDGSADFKERLSRLARELAVQQSVEFLGFLADPWIALQGVDAVVVSSRSEAFGRVTAEAMAGSIPVIGARAGGTVEIVGSNEERGFLYHAGDPESLAEAVERLVGHPRAVTDKIVRAARWVAVECAPLRVAENVYLLLREAVSKGTAGSDIA